MQAQVPMSVHWTQQVFQHPTPPRPWSHGLFGCFSDFGTCCLSMYCPCIVYGKNQEKIGNGDQGCLVYCLAQACCGLGFIVQCIGRGNVRAKLNVEGSSMGDLCVVCCCGTCALTQESQEIDSALGLK
ncbi:PLAC8 family-domain-containing protein [Zopfochytrium polystomum]|nr:PLAC8 family-domain-containing protein [Zopfochytrium polystomum]